MTSTEVHPALLDLDAATCSDGAPSARNLLVTVFGDVLAPLGPSTEVGVRDLADVLAGFGVNERLVRTSLTRLVNDDVLAVRAEGRRSFYRVAPAAIAMFASADRRIYRGGTVAWDGAWTLVVLDGAESTAGHRAELRHELAALGLGVVAPNVLGSPLVEPEAVAAVVARSGNFERVVVTRSRLAAGTGLSTDAELADRCLDLDRLAAGYAGIRDRLAAYDDEVLADLDGPRAGKLRLLVVAVFRRLVLADPMLPDAMLPTDWPGGQARREVARVYGAVAPAATRWLGDVLGVDAPDGAERFAEADRAAEES